MGGGQLSQFLDVRYLLDKKSACTRTAIVFLLVVAASGDRRRLAILAEYGSASAGPLLLCPIVLLCIC
jgi:hypothetical protein